MKNKLLLTCVITLLSVTTNAQLSGVYYIPGPVFPTVAYAIDSLNESGVGNGGVTFNINAGYYEPFSNPLNGVITTTTSNANQPIVFQKFGAGDNPLIMAATGTSLTSDAIFALGGTDYVTFDGIDIMENPLNTHGTPYMEFGFWLARGGPGDGTQHATIKNCTISGLKTGYSIGSTNHTLDYTVITPGSADGTNSFNQIYSNTVINTIPYSEEIAGPPVYFVTASTVATSGYWDDDNQIGLDNQAKSSGVEGNTFMNSMTVDCRYQRGLIIANNIFSSDAIYKYSLSREHIKTTGCMDVAIINNDIGGYIKQSGDFEPINDVSIGVVDISGNLVHDIDLSGGTGKFSGVLYNGKADMVTVSGNKVINIIFGKPTTGARVFRGISVMNSALQGGSVCNVFDNRVSDNVVTNKTTSTDNSYLFVSWLGWALNVYNNIISDNSANNTGTTNGLDVRTGGITFAGDKKVYDNRISNLSNTNGTFHAIRQENGVATYIYRNNISGISATGSSNPVINGITVGSASTGSVAIFNNYISELTTPFSSGTRQVTGINILDGKIADIFYNTVYLDASSTGTNFGSAGIYSVTSPLVRLRNNNVVNNSTPSGTGKTVAFWLSTSSLINFDPVSNNNNYYAGIPGATHLIFYDGTNACDSLFRYQIRVFPRESTSVTENPPFQNVATSPYDLHMSTNLPTQCENGGIVINNPLAAQSDFYNHPRYPNPGYPINPLFPPSHPDIGAEEFAGILMDLSAPSVMFTPLPNTSSLDERTLVTTITDLTGVPVSGTGMPVLYWTRNNGPWFSVTGVYTGNNQYHFTFGSGVALFDSVKYFIVAQDIKAPFPNMGSTPLGALGCTANPPTFATPPPKPSGYQILQGMCGNYYIGTGRDYGCLTEAVADLNAKSIDCPVTFILTDADYGNRDVFPITIQAVPGLSVNSPLTIKPAPGVVPVIKGSHTGSLITIIGAQYVTIDGSGNGGTDRSMMFYNSNSTDNATVLYLSSPGGGNTGARNITIRNCIIKANGHVTNTTHGIRTNSSTGGGYENILIDNNEILAARIGIRIQGTHAYPANNCTISNNMVGSPVDSLSMQLYGIYILYANNSVISHNHVMGPSVLGNANNSQVGIHLYTLATSSKVTGNEIHGFFNASTNYGASAIRFYAEATSVTEISNNIIYDIKGPGSSTTSSANDLCGINLGFGGNINVWHNTLNLTGAILASSYASRSGCIVVSANMSNVDCRNNILKNSIQPVSGTPDSRSFGMYCKGKANIFSNLNYNNYFIDGIGPNIGILNNTGECPTLIDWQEITHLEANSLNLNPEFVSPTVLQTAVPALNNAGIALAQVPIDFNGVIRTNPPDVGAYEFSLPIASINTFEATGIDLTLATLNGDINSAGEVVNVSFEYGTTTSYGNTIVATPSPIRSIAGAAFSAALTGLQPGTHYHFRAKGVSATASETVYSDDDTFTTLTAVPVNTSVQNTTVQNGVDTCFNATQTITVAGNGTTFVVETGGSATMIAGQNIIYLPGTVVLAGGYMLGIITLTGDYCGVQEVPIVAVTTGNEPDPDGSAKPMFSIYPNPTAGSFTIEFSGSAAPDASVEIYGIRGEKVLKTNVMGVNKQTISLDGQPTGLYFIRMVMDGKSETGKIIKQ